MIENNLQILGLTKNEISIYLAILKSGKTTATKIRKLTKITNSRVYAAIDILLSKGLIIYEKNQKGKIYSAIDPKILKEIASKKMKKIEETIPILKEIQNTKMEETETGVFEGYQGFKSAMLQVVNECPKGETIQIIGFSNQSYKDLKLASLLRDINKISIQKKHKFKMILDNEENKFYEQRKREKISEIRFMKKGFESPAAIDIYQDKVYILMWGEKPYAFYIKNKSIAKGFKVYFEFLWKMAKIN